MYPALKFDLDQIWSGLQLNCSKQLQCMPALWTGPYPTNQNDSVAFPMELVSQKEGGENFLQ